MGGGKICSFMETHLFLTASRVLLLHEKKPLSSVNEYKVSAGSCCGKLLIRPRKGGECSEMILKRLIIITMGGLETLPMARSYFFFLTKIAKVSIVCIIK